MGDYSQGHFRFALKKDTPREVIDNLAKLIDGEGFSIGEDRIYLGDSAYHHMPSFAEREESPEYAEDTAGMYCLTFQIKYGCRQLGSFAEWLKPHVVVTDANKGFFGYSISEYSSVPTVFLVEPLKRSTQDG